MSYDCPPSSSYCTVEESRNTAIDVIVSSYDYNEPNQKCEQAEECSTWNILASRDGIEALKRWHGRIIEALTLVRRRFDMRAMPRWSALRWRSIT